MIVRVVCGVLAAALILAVIAHPPETFGQVLSALLPSGMLVGLAIRGTGRTRMKRHPRRNDPPPPPNV